MKVDRKRSNFGIIDESTGRLPIDADLASNYRDDVVAYAEQLKAQHASDGKEYSDTFFLEFARREMGIRYLKSHELTQTGLDDVPDPQFAGYSYAEIINMANSGYVVPQEVLAWAKAQQEADVVDYVVVSTDAENDDNNQDEASNQSELNKLRVLAKSQIVKSSKSQKSLDKNTQDLEVLTENAAYIAKKQENIIKNGSLDKMGDMIKEWKALDEKQKTEELTPSEKDTYKKLSQMISSSKKTFKEVENTAKDLDEFLASIDDIRVESTDAQSIGQETIDVSYNLSKIRNPISEVNQKHTYQTVKSSDPGLLNDILAGVTDDTISYVAEHIGIDLQDTGKTVIEDISGGVKKEISDFAKEYSAKAQEIREFSQNNIGEGSDNVENEETPEEPTVEPEEPTTEPTAAPEEPAGEQEMSFAGGNVKSNIASVEGESPEIINNPPSANQGAPETQINLANTAKPVAKANIGQKISGNNNRLAFKENNGVQNTNDNNDSDGSEVLTNTPAAVGNAVMSAGKGLQNLFGFMFPYMAVPDVALASTLLTVAATAETTAEAVVLNKVTNSLAKAIIGTQNDDSKLEQDAKKTVEGYTANNSIIEENNIIIQNQQGNVSQYIAENAGLKAENEQLVSGIQNPLKQSAKNIAKSQKDKSDLVITEKVLKSSSKALQKSADFTLEAGETNLKAGIFNCALSLGLMKAGTAMMASINPSTVIMGMIMFGAGQTWLDVVGLNEMIAGPIAVAGAVVGNAGVAFADAQITDSIIGEKDANSSIKRSVSFLQETSKSMGGLDIANVGNEKEPTQPSPVQNQSNPGVVSFAGGSALNNVVAPVASNTTDESGNIFEENVNEETKFIPQNQEGGMIFAAGNASQNVVTGFASSFGFQVPATDDAQTSEEPSVEPTVAPEEPSEVEEPSVEPTVAPEEPSEVEEPSVEPTVAPEEPSEVEEPSVEPTVAPEEPSEVEEPSVEPTVAPEEPLEIEEPSVEPTVAPEEPSEVEEPSVEPTVAPEEPLEVEEPSVEPTVAPEEPLEVEEPSVEPTVAPEEPLEVEEPSVEPTVAPEEPSEVEEPSVEPTVAPEEPSEVEEPSVEPTVAPEEPSEVEEPSVEPTVAPEEPSEVEEPSVEPTVAPEESLEVEEPSVEPTVAPEESNEDEEVLFTSGRASKNVSVSEEPTTVAPVVQNPASLAEEPEEPSASDNNKTEDANNVKKNKNTDNKNVNQLKKSSDKNNDLKSQYGNNVDYAALAAGGILTSATAAFGLMGYGQFYPIAAAALAVISASIADLNKKDDIVSAGADTAGLDVNKADKSVANLASDGKKVLISHNQNMETINNLNANYKLINDENVDVEPSEDENSDGAAMNSANLDKKAEIYDELGNIVVEDNKLIDKAQKPTETANANVKESKGAVSALTEVSGKLSERSDNNAIAGGIGITFGFMGAGVAAGVIAEGIALLSFPEAFSKALGRMFIKNGLIGLSASLLVVATGVRAESTSSHVDKNITGYREDAASDKSALKKADKLIKANTKDLRIAASETANTDSPVEGEEKPVNTVSESNEGEDRPVDENDKKVSFVAGKASANVAASTTTESEPPVEEPAKNNAPVSQEPPAQEDENPNNAFEGLENPNDKTQELMNFMNFVSSVSHRNIRNTYTPSAPKNEQAVPAGNSTTRGRNEDSKDNKDDNKNRTQGARSSSGASSGAKKGGAMVSKYGSNTSFNKLYTEASLGISVADVFQLIGLGEVVLARIAATLVIGGASVGDLLMKKGIVSEAGDIAEDSTKTSQKQMSKLEADSKAAVVEHNKNMLQVKELGVQYKALNSQSINFNYALVQANKSVAARRGDNQASQMEVGPNMYDAMMEGVVDQIGAISDKDSKIIDKAVNPQERAKMAMKSAQLDVTDFSTVNDKLSARNDDNNALAKRLVITGASGVALGVAGVILGKSMCASIGGFSNGIKLIIISLAVIAECTVMGATGGAMMLVSNSVGNKIDSNHEDVGKNSVSLGKDQKRFLDSRKMLAKAQLEIPHVESEKEEGPAFDNSDSGNSDNNFSGGSGKRSVVSGQNDNDESRRSAASSVMVNSSVETTDKSERRLARFNDDGVVLANRKNRRVNAASASSNGRSRR